MRCAGRRAARPQGSHGGTPTGAAARGVRTAHSRADECGADRRPPRKAAGPTAIAERKGARPEAGRRASSAASSARPQRNRPVPASETDAGSWSVVLGTEDGLRRRTVATVVVGRSAGAHPRKRRRVVSVALGTVAAVERVVADPSEMRVAARPQRSTSSRSVDPRKGAGVSVDSEPRGGRVRRYADVFDPSQR